MREAPALADVSITEAKWVTRLEQAREQMLGQMHRVIVGQNEVLEQLVYAILCRGHCLLEGVPGLAKTVMVQTLGATLNLTFRRIQFTPDLMPSDITGTDIIQEDPHTGRRQLRIHRRVRSSRTCCWPTKSTARRPRRRRRCWRRCRSGGQLGRGRTYELPNPFFVLATQNPIEQEGTYPLPEAQLDRFMFMVKIGYPGRSDEIEILKRTTRRPPPKVQALFSAEEILELQKAVRRVPIADHVYDYVINLVRSTRPGLPKCRKPPNGCNGAPVRAPAKC